MIIRNFLATGPLTYKTADAGSMLEPAVIQNQMFSPLILVQKTGDIETNIEYVYTTTDDPTSGAIKFNVRWLPLTSDANVAAV
jgi:hypothetical protein